MIWRPSEKGEVGGDGDRRLFFSFGDDLEEQLAAAGVELDVVSGSASPVQAYGPGDEIPNYTLKSPEGLTVFSGSTTVDSSTSISDLLQPNMGTCHWAACVNVR